MHIRTCKPSHSLAQLTWYHLKLFSYRPLPCYYCYYSHYRHYCYHPTIVTIVIFHQPYHSCWGFHSSFELLLRFAAAALLSKLQGLAGPHAPLFKFSMPVFSAAAHSGATIDATTANTAAATTLFTALFLHLVLPLHLNFFYKGFFSLLTTFHHLRRHLVSSVLLPTELFDS